MPEGSMIDQVRRLFPEASATTTDRDEARAALDAEIATGADGLGRLPFSRRTGQRWLIPGAALTAAAATLLLVFVGGPEGTVSTSSAAEVLRQAAAAELDTAPPLPGPGQYLYVKSEDAYMSSFVEGQGVPAPAPGTKPPETVDPSQAVEPKIAYSMLVPHTREVWMGSENSLLQTRSGPPTFLTEGDRRSWEAHGSPEAKGGFGVDHLGPTKPLDLPSDPDELYDQFHAKAARIAINPYAPDGEAAVEPAQSIGYQMFSMIGESLRERSATPEQRAALFEVASRLDGIELAGDVTDSAGRPGIAIAILDPRTGLRETLIFDPDTYALLAEEEVVAADDNEFGYPVGTVVGHSTYLERAIVDKSEERP